MAISARCRWPPGELVDEAILEFFQFHVGNGSVDDLLILWGDTVA